MKKFFLGLLFACGVLLAGAEPVDDDTLKPMLVNLGGVALVALSAFLFRRWRICDDRWVKDFCDKD